MCFLLSQKNFADGGSVSRRVRGMDGLCSSVSARARAGWHLFEL